MQLFVELFLKFLVVIYGDRVLSPSQQARLDSILFNFFRWFPGPEPAAESHPLVSVGPTRKQ